MKQTMQQKYIHAGCRQNGQSSMEYTIICSVFAFILGVGMMDDNSVLHELLAGFQTAYQKISYALSLPN